MPWRRFKVNSAPFYTMTCPSQYILAKNVVISLLITRPRLSYGEESPKIDITELRKGEDKQATLAAIIESSYDAIISKTLDGIITSWNDAAEYMLGYSEKEALGKHITLLTPKDRLSGETLIIGKIKKGEKIDHCLKYFEYYSDAPNGRSVSIIWAGISV